ncbi:MAG: hypothetical protein CMH61_02170 [Nanoarchaeota archaeon]|nr:hypothetical protein [Nanoarchaeota archaeon]|tara:strand:+ start:3176 stop:3433 length:258 start_codon:yes stop_codon:yes gene_type:complete
MEIHSMGEDAYEVIVQEQKFMVILDEGTYQELTKEKYSVNELIRGTFRFLVDREPLEQVMRKFNVRMVSSFFPEFPDKIEEYMED